MQKLEYIRCVNRFDLESIDKQYLKNGWFVKQMVVIGGDLIILLEKETRKDKLEHLNDIQQ